VAVEADFLVVYSALVVKDKKEDSFFSFHEMMLLPIIATSPKYEYEVSVEGVSSQHKMIIHFSGVSPVYIGIYVNVICDYVKYCDMSQHPPSRLDTDNRGRKTKESKKY
jgi:hypothetical protein